MKKTVFLNLSKMQLLGQRDNIALFLTIWWQKKIEIKVAYITEYEPLVKHFSELLWQIDPHYLKVKKRGIFLKTVEKSFLGINDPSKHKYAVKNLCSESLVLKVQNLYNYINRQYLNSSHMKPLQLILINGTEKLTAYLTELEEQNERTTKSHEKLCKNTNGEDFVVRFIFTYTSVVENFWSNRLAEIRELFQNKNVYDPIVMNNLWMLWTWKWIKNMLC